MDNSGTEKQSLGRNYSFYWSQSDVVALWVAYPMFGAVAESKVSRIDAYAVDPLINAKKQPSTGGYSGDYSRGHQIPSADRLSSRAMNNTVFYMTNMTPQNQTFNGGLWAQLETKVRSWASGADEFYVVTGCLVKNSTRTTTSNGLTVTVPTHYYKAFLRKLVSNDGTAKWTACAYIYEHFTSQTSFSVDDLISIDELETQTGVDFFPNLEGVVGTTEYEKVERTATKFSSK